MAVVYDPINKVWKIAQVQEDGNNNGGQQFQQDQGQGEDPGARHRMHPEPNYPRFGRYEDRQWPPLIEIPKPQYQPNQILQNQIAASQQAITPDRNYMPKYQMAPGTPAARWGTGQSLDMSKYVPWMPKNLGFGGGGSVPSGGSGGGNGGAPGSNGGNNLGFGGSLIGSTTSDPNRVLNTLLSSGTGNEGRPYTAPHDATPIAPSAAIGYGTGDRQSMYTDPTTGRQVSLAGAYNAPGPGTPEYNAYFANRQSPYFSSLNQGTSATSPWRIIGGVADPTGMQEWQALANAYRSNPGVANGMSAQNMANLQYQLANSKG